MVAANSEGLLRTAIYKLIKYKIAREDKTFMESKNIEDFYPGEYILTPDKRRRITLPDALFGDISDDEDLVAIRCLDHCEIWRRKVWEQKY